MSLVKEKIQPFSIKNIFSGWNNGHIERIVDENTTYWQTHLGKIDTKTTELGSGLNDYGDINKIYPSSTGWAWIEKKTQKIFFTSLDKEECIYHPQRNQYCGEIIFVSDQILAFIMENRKKQLWSIIQINILTKEISTRLTLNKVISSLIKKNNNLAFITYKIGQNPWHSTQINELDENNQIITYDKIVVANYSQLKYSNESLYVLAEIDDKRGLYQIENQNLIALTPQDIEIGELSWIRKRQDYYIYNNTIYLASVDAGVWFWYKIENNKLQALHCPFLEHFYFIEVYDNLYICGANAQESGIFNINGEQTTIKTQNKKIIWHNHFLIANNKLHSQSWSLQRKKSSGTIVYLHGGPALVSGPKDHNASNTYLEHNYQVIHINTIGSSSFGKKYREALNGVWGERDSQDIEKHLNEYKIVRPLIIIGRSSSGFTALNIKNADALILYYPVINPYELLNTENPFETGYLQDLLGQRQKQDKKITCPILIFHGRNDTIVPYTISQKWFKMNQNNHPMNKLKIIDNEGHGFSKTTREDLLNQELLWLEQIREKYEKQN